MTGIELFTANEVVMVNFIKLLSNIMNISIKKCMSETCFLFQNEMQNFAIDS